MQGFTSAGDRGPFPASLRPDKSEFEDKHLGCTCDKNVWTPRVSDIVSVTDVSSWQSLYQPFILFGQHRSDKSRPTCTGMVTRNFAVRQVCFGGKWPLGWRNLRFSLEARLGNGTNWGCFDSWDPAGIQLGSRPTWLHLRRCTPKSSKVIREDKDGTTLPALVIRAQGSGNSVCMLNGYRHSIEKNMCLVHSFPCDSCVLLLSGAKVWILGQHHHENWSGLVEMTSAFC